MSDEMREIFKQAALGVPSDATGEPIALIPHDSPQPWTIARREGVVHAWPNREPGHVATIIGECSCMPEVLSRGKAYFFLHHAFDPGYPAPGPQEG